MATTIEFRVSDSGLIKILDAAKKSEQVEKSREKAQKHSEKLYDKQIKALQKEYLERKKIQKKIAQLQQKADRKRITAEKQQAAARKKSFQDTQKLMRGDLSPTLERMGGKGALLGGALSIGSAALTSLAAAGGMVAKLAIDAGKARDNAEGMLSVMSGGDPKMLEKIDGLARDLGLSVDVAREKFVEFRQKGLSVSESAQLLKTFADVRSAQGAIAADASLDAVFGDVSAGFKFADALKVVHEQTGVTGDGALAAANKFRDLNSTFDRLSSSKTKALETLWDALEKPLTSYTNTLAEFFEELSAGGDENKIAKLVNLQLPMTEREIKYLKSLFTEFFDGFTSQIDAFWDNLSGRFKRGLGKIASFAGDWYNAGADLMKGLGKGIASYAEKVWKQITDLGAGIKNKFKSVLGIRSPSVVFEQLGEHTIAGLDRGIERNADKPERAIGKVAEQLPTAFAAAAPAAAPQSSAGVTITIENINVPAGSDPDAHARSIRREIELMVQSLLLQRGLA